MNRRKSRPQTLRTLTRRQQNFVRYYAAGLGIAAAKAAGYTERTARCYLPDLLALQPVREALKARGVDLDAPPCPTCGTMQHTRRK